MGAHHAHLLLAREVSAIPAEAWPDTIFAYGHGIKSMICEPFHEPYIMKDAPYFYALLSLPHQGIMQGEARFIFFLTSEDL